MTVVKFHLSGDTACFRKPDVNTYVYFTYGQIHKVALLGMFGAILGYSGYTECTAKIKNTRQMQLPEFYERLKILETAVVPCTSNGVFSKKIQRFNNSVGYASKENGGNLIVSEQWLEHPAWDIYVRIDGKEGEAVRNALVNHTCVFAPYLGKNDHMASISDVEVMEEKKIDNLEQIHSLFPKRLGRLDMELLEDEPFSYYKYEETLPVGLEPIDFRYSMENLIYTNIPIVDFTGVAYQIGEKNIVFF